MSQRSKVNVCLTPCIVILCCVAADSLSDGLFWSGIIFSNGENWREMRRFALNNLRDLGMGKRGSEEKIIEEIEYLKGEFDKFEGTSWDTHGIMLLVYKIHWEMVCYFLFTEKPFDTTQPVNYAVSNIISSIMYGSRFEYTDPQFTAMVDRANENVRVAGSTSMMVIMIYMLTWIVSTANRHCKMYYLHMDLFCIFV